MQSTDNYGFSLPEDGEFYDVETQNENWSKLDAALKEIRDKLEQTE